MRFGQGGKKEEALADAARIASAGLGTRSVVLVGLMGCGKTAVGRRLAPQLGLPFIDADEEIEKAAGKTIEEIFADHGEAYFRDRERRVMARLLAAGPQVLATGGGAFMSDETRENVRRAAISVWLKAELGLLVKRVSKRDHRPMLKGRNAETVMKELMETRYPVYATADIIVESRDVPHDTIVAEVIQALAANPLLAGAAAEGDPA